MTGWYVIQHISTDFFSLILSLKSGLVVADQGFFKIGTWLVKCNIYKLSMSSLSDFFYFRSPVGIPSFKKKWKNFEY